MPRMVRNVNGNEVTATCPFLKSGKCVSSCAMLVETGNGKFVCSRSLDVSFDLAKLLDIVPVYMEMKDRHESM